MAAPAGGAIHFEVYHVALTVFVRESERCGFEARSARQSTLEYFGTLVRNTESRLKHPGFMSAARMQRVEAIIPQLLNVDDGVRTIGELHFQEIRFPNATLKIK
jgi:hypothetical protein